MIEDTPLSALTRHNLYVYRNTNDRQKELPDEAAWPSVKAEACGKKIDIMMVGPLEPGTWILAWNGTAMDVLTEDRAAQVKQSVRFSGKRDERES